MPLSSRKFAVSTRGKHARLVLRLMRLMLRRWLTVRELKAATKMDEGALRNWLQVMEQDGALRMRRRPHEMQEDGNKPSGPEPREYKVRTRWGDL